jgi:hypothetical protein
MAIKSYRRSGPKGKMSSALPLLALALGLFAISRSVKGQGQGAAQTRIGPVRIKEPGDDLLDDEPPAAPSSSAPATEAEKVWARALVDAINNSGVEVGPERQADLVEMMGELNALPNARAQGLRNIRAAMQAGLPPSLTTYCQTVMGTIPGVVPLASRAEIRERWPITSGLIAELCNEGEIV